MRHTGIDVPSVTAWMTAAIADLCAPLRFEQIAGGRSNLTFRVVDRDERAWVLRRPPAHGVLPTAHDMEREYRIISALRTASGVPVPQPVALCTDRAVTGAPFYLMNLVEGYVLSTASAAERFPLAMRPAATSALVGTLADVHAVDVDAVGLGDLGRRDGYIERQLTRWLSQYRAAPPSAADACIERVHETLRAAIPHQQATAIVHGDYRFDNVILDDSGNVRAVLDWELCTLGDPLADLGLLYVYWFEADDVLATMLPAPTSVTGFGARANLAVHYAAHSQLDLSHLDYYVGFAYWKLACILHGVATRYASGARAGGEADVETYRRIVITLAERAAHATGSFG